MITERIELNERIKKALKDKGWTQSEFAEFIGVSQSRLHYVLSKRGALSPFLCLMLEKAGVENAEYWINEDAKCKLIEGRAKVHERVKELEESLKNSNGFKKAKIRQYLDFLH